MASNELEDLLRGYFSLFEGTVENWVLFNFVFVSLCIHQVVLNCKLDKLALDLLAGSDCILQVDHFCK